MSAGFYSKEGNTLNYAGTSVTFPEGFLLLSEFSSSYTYPVQGWYWFNSIEEAREFLKVSENENLFVNPYDNGVPQYITAGQARLILLRKGYYSSILNYIKSLSEDNEVRIAWESGLRFYRKSPMVNSIGQLFNLSQQDLDNLFSEGSKIEV